jgi:hypothetical protein
LPARSVALSLNSTYRCIYQVTFSIAYWVVAYWAFSNIEFSYWLSPSRLRSAAALIKEKAPGILAKAMLMKTISDGISLASSEYTAQTVIRRQLGTTAYAVKRGKGSLDMIPMSSKLLYTQQAPGALSSMSYALSLLFCAILAVSRPSVSYRTFDNMRIHDFPTYRINDLSH